MAVAYMRRKLGAGLVQQVLDCRGRSKRAKVDRWKQMHRVIDGVMCMEHRIARLQMVAHLHVCSQPALHRKGATRTLFTQTSQCEVGVRHRGAKSDTERSKQNKEK